MEVRFSFVFLWCATICFIARPIFVNAYRMPQHLLSKIQLYSREAMDDRLDDLKFSKVIKIDTTVQAPLESIELSPITLKALKEKSFKHFTPVQFQAFPHVMSGVDVVARSRTGTGKTYAFGLPLVEKMLSSGSSKIRSYQNLPIVLVLEPTRELALQVTKELTDVCKANDIKVLAMYGGSSFQNQIDMLHMGAHIVVATPGRILDHLKQGTIDLSHVSSVVLDEGDTMLEMGFQQAVEAILENIKCPGEESRKRASNALEGSGAQLNDRGAVSSKRQSQILLFSATMPPWIRSITDRLMTSPVFLDAVQEGENKLSSLIKHVSITLPSSDTNRMKTVSSIIESVILQYSKKQRAIVFVKRREDADDLTSLKCFKSLSVGTLHGGIAQASRQKIIDSFKAGRIDVLLATDVAARGLDVSDVDLVVHTELPPDSDTFVHRSGRTGRAGKNGTSITFITQNEKYKLRHFENLYNFVFESGHLPTLQSSLQSAAEQSIDVINSIDDYSVELFQTYASRLIAQMSLDTVSSDPLHSNEFVEKLLAKCMAAISKQCGTTVTR
jgi:ATP-dependent RNA helicase DDX21